MSMLRNLFQLAAVAHGVIDENGNWQQGGDMDDMMPKVSEEDMEKLKDAPEMPQEHIFKLLFYEMGTYNFARNKDYIDFNDWEDFNELDCVEKMASIANESNNLSADLTTMHYNLTGTAGLFYLVKDKTNPAIEMSWPWVVQHFLQRTQQLIQKYMSKLLLFTMNTRTNSGGCLALSPMLRKALVDSLVSLKAVSTDQYSLYFNGLAFGLLGDVTADTPEAHEQARRESEAERLGVSVDEIPYIPPKPMSDEERMNGRSTFNTNLIFANMYTGRLTQWAQSYAQVIHETAMYEAQRLASEGKTTPPRSFEETRTHHQDEHGMFVPYESLRREVFHQWALDKGVMRGFLKYVVKDLYADSRLVDFGAGGGQYSKYLNDTGLVTAWAFDGIKNVDQVTKGAVTYWNLAGGEPPAWIANDASFDYGLCLEVLEHIPVEYTDSVLKTITKHVNKRLIMSWSADRDGIGHVNFLPESEWHPLVESYGWKLNKDLTATLKTMAQIPYISNSVTVFDRVEDSFFAEL